MAKKRKSKPKRQVQLQGTFTVKGPRALAGPRAPQVPLQGTFTVKGPRALAGPRSLRGPRAPQGPRSPG